MLQQTDLFYIPRHVLSAQIARIVPSAFPFNSQQRARDNNYPGLFLSLNRALLVGSDYFLVIKTLVAYKIRFHNDHLTILLSIHLITKQHSFHLDRARPYSCSIQSIA